MQQQHSTKVYLKSKLQSTLDDLIADISGAQLPELPVPELPPPPPPAPPADPPTAPSPDQRSIAIHKVARLEEQLMLLTNTLRVMHKDTQEVHAEGTENTFLGNSDDPDACFDRALDNFADLNGHLREASHRMVTKLLAKNVESNARQIAELEGQNDWLDEEILGFHQRMEALRAAQTPADQPKPKPPESHTEKEAAPRPSPPQTEETGGLRTAPRAEWGIPLVRALAPGQDILAAIHALSDCVGVSDGWQLREFAEQVERIAQATERMPRPRSPKCNGQGRVPDSEQRAIKALHRWQQKHLMLV